MVLISVEYHGRFWLLADLAKHAGLKYATLTTRLNTLGWDVERAVETPVDRVKGHHRKRRPRREAK